MDAQEECARIVRAADRDRYLADLYAPEGPRAALFALHAFAAEAEGVRDRVSQPMPGEIRLQWWRDALAGDDGGHPVARALKEAVVRFALPLRPLENLIEARRFDLYDDPMPSVAGFEGHAGDTVSAPIQLAAMALAGGSDPGTAEAAGHAGVALAVARALRDLPKQAGRGQCFIPAELLGRHGASPDDILAGRVTPGLAAALADFRAMGRTHLAAARRAFAGADRSLLPAFLPAALVEADLAAAERTPDPFRPGPPEAPWRRQWRLWRAARRGGF